MNSIGLSAHPIQGSVAIPDTELSLLVPGVSRSHSQMVNDRLWAGLAVADSQENIIFNPGEKTELQGIYLLILTVIKLNSVLNIEEYPRHE